MKVAIKGVSSHFIFINSFAPLMLGRISSRADFWTWAKLVERQFFGDFWAISPLPLLDKLSKGQIFAFLVIFAPFCGLQFVP